MITVKVKCEVVLSKDPQGVVMMFENETIKSLLQRKAPERKYNIHFVSQNKVGVLDWFLAEDGSIYQCHKVMQGKVYTDDEEVYFFPQYIKRVEASTTVNTSLPKIPTGFIEKYVEERGKIFEVFIDHEQTGPDTSTVKVRSNNTVIVSSVKNTFTIDEVNITVNKALKQFLSLAIGKLPDEQSQNLIQQVFKQVSNISDFTKL